MMEIYDHHLDMISERMGGFLRGFGDPHVHLGSTSRFNAEFRKVMVLPALKPSGAHRILSYVEAAASCRISPVIAASAGPVDPVSIMIRGLIEAPSLSAASRIDFPHENLRKDVTLLLRSPVLLFYISTSDREPFLAGLAGIASRDGFPLITSTDQSQEIAGQCRFCGSAMISSRRDVALRCGNCRRVYETVRALPMTQGVIALVSFEMLRRIVALDLVSNYQEEGKFVPLRHGSNNL